MTEANFSEFDLCLRRAADARSMAARAEDATARDALEVVAENWESLGRDLTRSAAPQTPSRKGEARRSALGLETLA